MTITDLVAPEAILPALKVNTKKQALPKLEKLFGFFARLERPIDFEAMDGQPVDLVFLLLAPEGAGADHLKALARIARLLRDQDVAKKLRASRDAQAIYSVLALPPASAA